MTLLQMRYILEVERCGSMNRAAQDLFISQSALSTAILEVEKELGITIFRRSNRGVVLTEDGHQVQEAANGHEGLAHLKHRDHDKGFYQLCTHMSPSYHRLEFDLRLYLTQLELDAAARRANTATPDADSDTD